MVNISLFSTGPDVLYSFPATEMREHQDLYPSHLVVTADSLVVLRELSDRAGWGRVKHRHRLSSILKITSKKKHPDIITLCVCQSLSAHRPTSTPALVIEVATQQFPPAHPGGRYCY
jgi:hypothetical protein